MERFSRFTLRHRRGLAAALTGLAAFCALSAVTDEPPGHPAVVATHDLDSGVRLAASDVRVVQRPEESLTATAPTSAADVIGRITSGAMREGEIFSDRRTVTTGPLDGYGPDRVLASVRINDPSVAAILRPGDAVDVLGVSGDDPPTATVIARRARVVSVRRAAGQFNDSVPVGLAVSRSDAMALAARSLEARLTRVATR